LGQTVENDWNIELIVSQLQNSTEDKIGCANIGWITFAEQIIDKFGQTLLIEFGWKLLECVGQIENTFQS